MWLSREGGIFEGGIFSVSYTSTLKNSLQHKLTVATHLSKVTEC